MKQKIEQRRKELSEEFHREFIKDFYGFPDKDDLTKHIDEWTEEDKL